MPSLVERLAAQALAQELDDLAGAAQRLVVGHAVEALDDLRAGGAEADDRAAAGDVVEAGRGLQQGAGGAGVDVEDAGADLDASRSWPRGSPSAWGSRSRRARRPRSCPARPSPARPPGRRSRGGSRRRSSGIESFMFPLLRVEVRGSPDRDRIAVTMARVVVGGGVDARGGIIGPLPGVPGDHSTSEWRRRE